MQTTRKQADKHNIEMRDYYLNKFNDKCIKCGSTEHLEFDHIKPISLGGDNSEENIQVLCRPCNRKKGGKRYRGGYTGHRVIGEDISIRIDQDLLDEVKKSAKYNERSVNAQIRFFIKEGLDKSEYIEIGNTGTYKLK